jgi:hypothetical protein
MKKYLLIIPFFLFSASLCFAAFSYYIPITIQHGKVANTVTENYTKFPIDVDVTQSTLMATSSGGHSQITNGWDIQFYSNSNCSTGRLPAERELYTPTTGRYTGWVQFAVSTTSDQTIYACYGNSGISTDPNSDGTYGATSVWDSNYKGVWHLPNGSSLNLSDSTSNVNTGTNHSVTATTGQVDGGANFNGSSYIDIGSPSSLQIAGVLTAEVWLKVPSFPGSAETPLVNQGYNGSGFGWNLELYGFGTNQLRFGTATYAWSNLSTGVWYHIAGVYDGANSILYVNGVAVNTTAGGAPFNSGRAVEIGAFDNQGTPGSEPLTGVLDEVKVSNTNRSADWIKTEYNNQSATSTFYTLGSETPIVTYTPTPANLFHKFLFGIGFKFILNKGFQFIFK